MDEPLSNLDAKMRTQTRAELVELHQRLGTTFVYVTHDQVEAMTMGTRVAVLESGRSSRSAPPGGLRAAGQRVRRPLHRQPADEHASTGAITDRDGTRFLRLPGFEIALPPSWPATSTPRPPHRRRRAGVRPEHLVVAEDGVPVKLRVVESLGHERHLVCEAESGELLIVRTPAEAARPAEGSMIHLMTEPSRLHLFDATTGERIG
jgi:multiple sugar transport system ATP-binding protein